MKKRWAACGLLVVLACLLALIGSSAPARALPEYATQTGEPCATCHVSPSGGGQRVPRGQAWVGAGKPGAVPDLAAALAALGVHFQANPQDYVAAPGAVAPAKPLPLQRGQAQAFDRVLQDYAGN